MFGDLEVFRAKSAGMVGERSIHSEGEPEGLLESMEVRMPV